MKKLAIKVCGMRDEDNIKHLSSLKPDFLGLIFYKGSKRYVGDSFGQEKIQHIPEHTKKVGVFVNSSNKEIIKLARLYSLDYIQLHGNEAPEQCKALQEDGYRVIKAFSLHGLFNFELLKQYEPYVEYFLFDTKGKEYGGNGVAFDWEILKNYTLDKPFFLSGGIDLTHVKNIKSLALKNLYALDLNSRFEIQPGFKDIGKLSLFFTEIRV